MKQINPSCKLIGLIVVTFTIAFVHNPVLNMAVFALTAIMILSSEANRKGYLASMVPILILAVGLFFTGYRFTSSDAEITVVNLSNQHLRNSRVWNGMIFASRILVYSGIGFLYAFTTDRIRMIRSFEKQLHVPQVFAYGLLAAWGLFPKMSQEFRRTRMAFRARGIHVYPFSPSLLITLMVKSVRWSEGLSIAMESKGFDGHEERTTYQPERVMKKDIVFLIICCAVFPMAAVWLFQ